MTWAPTCARAAQLIPGLGNDCQRCRDLHQPAGVAQPHGTLWRVRRPASAPPPPLRRRPPAASPSNHCSPAPASLDAGRYSTSGWGLLIPGKLAWVTQELWSFAIPAAALLLATQEQRMRAAAPANALLLGVEARGGGRVRGVGVKGGGAGVLSRSHDARPPPPLSPHTGAFLLHYANRDFIYPLCLRGAKPTPVTVWAMAAVFCIYNGWMQARSASPAVIF